MAISTLANRALERDGLAPIRDKVDDPAGGRDSCAAPTVDGALRAPGPSLAPGQPHSAAPALARDLPEDP